jgi:hypothetical protein
MYSEKLENLIEMALADGILSEKEKQVLFKNAKEEGIDLDEFEIVLDARLHQRGQAILPKENSEKQSALATLLQLLDEVEQDEREKLEKEIKKFAIKNNITSAIKDLAEITSRALSMTTGGIGGFVAGEAAKKLGRRNGNKAEEKIRKLTNDARRRIKEKKINIISAFPVPSSKEDVLNFLEYIYPKKNDDVQNMWSDKFHEILLRSKMNFSYDKTFLAEICQYEKRYNEQQQKKKDLIIERKQQQIEREQQQKRKNLIITMITIPIAAVIIFIIGTWIYTNEQKHSGAKLQEKARLEQILDNVNLSFKKQNLDEAEYLTNQLVWKYESSWGDCEKEKEVWNKEREEWIKKIQQIKHSKAKLQEKTRLEQILNNVNLSIKNRDLDEAEYLTNQLVWKYKSSWDNCKDEKESWDKERKELIKRIQQIKDPEKANKKGLVDKVKDLFN